MLGRYRIVRGKRPEGEPLPEGLRQDTRKHTRHLLRPPEALVDVFLSAPSEASYRKFARGYLAVLEERWTTERARFDELARLASREVVLLGCNCPTSKQPDVLRCHTVLALRFFRERYPELAVEMPETRGA